MADQGEGPAAPPPPLFLDQIEAQGAEKNFFGDTPPLSQGLSDPALLLFIPSVNILSEYFYVSLTLVAVLTV